MMVSEPRLAGSRRRFALVQRFAGCPSQAMNDQKGAGGKEEPAEQTDQPVRSVLVTAKKAQGSALDQNACNQKREPKEHRFPARDRGSALCRVVPQDGGHTQTASGALLGELWSRCESHGHRHFDRICPSAMHAAMELARISKRSQHVC